jgi:hypothetical protein
MVKRLAAGNADLVRSGIHNEKSLIASVASGAVDQDN